MNKFVVTFCSAALLVPLVLRAEAPATQPATQPAPQTLSDAPPAAPNRNIGGAFGATLTSAYMSRGRVLENKGVIVQPWAEIDLTLLPKSVGVLDKVTGFGGIWNSLNGDHRYAAPDSNNPTWYEFDWYVGSSWVWAKNLTTTASYWEVTSPSNAFPTFDYFEFKVAYNDSDLWGSSGFSLSPWARVIIPVHGLAGTGPDKGQYLDLGIAPGTTLFATSDIPLHLAMPVTVGMGFDKFYTDASGINKTLGFASVGVTAGIPLKFMADAGLGSWSLTAGATYYYLADGVRDFNALVVNTTGKNTSGIVVGSVGLSCGF